MMRSQLWVPQCSSYVSHTGHTTVKLKQHPSASCQTHHRGESEHFPARTPAVTENVLPLGWSSDKVNCPEGLKRGLKTSDRNYCSVAGTVAQRLEMSRSCLIIPRVDALSAREYNAQADPTSKLMRSYPCQIFKNNQIHKASDFFPNTAITDYHKLVTLNSIRVVS